ncbi:MULTISPECIES: hypothetical protein [Bacillus]|mgnify:CR=1 FL=1|uniref:hypothetical protein n=1 Tax=Bacillus TaxID=1386 RepID=UPI001583E15F|nr:hypothetical protein [Bacillus glycinifermentans]MBU8789014.1 hypothetical protein [Bacillus glycinifermentans]NUJ18020.1 hypothetical protein [Bacillus glycinifermentans]WKB77960.1 hypothetical protein QYM22_03475 [Bacillus glycinifermentans]
MKVMVIKTDAHLSKDAKEAIRGEVKSAIETGVMVLDRGLDISTIEVDEFQISEPFSEVKSFSPEEGVINAVNYVGSKYAMPVIGVGTAIPAGDANGLEPQPLKSAKKTPLLQIELEDIDSAAPRIFYKGKRVEGIISADFSYLTKDDKAINPTLIDIEYKDKESKFGTKSIVYNRYFHDQRGSS